MSELSGVRLNAQNKIACNAEKAKNKAAFAAKGTLATGAYVGAGLLGLNSVYNNGSLSKFPKLNAAICKALTNVEDGACKLFTQIKNSKAIENFKNASKSEKGLMIAMPALLLGLITKVAISYNKMSHENDLTEQKYVYKQKAQNAANVI